MVNHPDGEIVRAISAHQGNVSAIAIDQASGRFASGSEAGEIAIWSRDGDLISRRQEHSGAVADLVFTKVGDRLISASDDRTIAVYNVVTSQRELLIRHSREKCRAVAISPEGETIAFGGADREITLCDSKTGELQATLEGHSDTISDLQFAPDGNALFSLSLDGTLRRWTPSDF